MKSLLKKIIPIFLLLLCITILCACNKTNCEQGHTWELTSTTATCLNNGTETYTCKICKTTKNENVEAYGHDLVQSSYTAPTCKTNGEKVEKCSRCGFENKQTLLVVDHDWQVKSTTPSTCTVKGSQTLECSMCHDTKTVALELKDHDYKLVSTTESTCITHGYKNYKCNKCVASHREELPLGEHKYETKNKEATCFTHGGTVEKCSVCQDEKAVSQTPLLTHNFDTDGYCTHCSIYKTLFDENVISTTYKGVVISGNLTAKFNNANNTIPDEYWKDHTVTLTITMYDTDGKELEKQSFNSTTIPHEGNNYGKLTIQYVDVGGRLGNSYANAFIIFVDEGNIFSPESRQNCTSFKIELSCDDYEMIEKTYEVTKD